MSELLDKIKSRRSIRKFKSDAVPEDIWIKLSRRALMPQRE